MSPHGLGRFKFGTAHSPDAVGTGQWPGEQWGSQGGDLKQIENYISYERVFTEIQGLLHYPGALGRRDIAGGVNARLHFTEDSQCDWKKTWVKSPSPYLRFYIIALLKKLCGLENIRHARLRSHQFLDINFNFILGEGEDQMEAEQKDVLVSNVFSFTRIHHKPPYEYQLGPIRGFWFAPVVYLDYPWLVEKWDQIVEGHDPMKEFQE